MKSHINNKLQNLSFDNVQVKTSTVQDIANKIRNIMQWDYTSRMILHTYVNPWLWEYQVDYKQQLFQTN